MGGVPRISNTDGAFCFICKSEFKNLASLKIIAKTSKSNSGLFHFLYHRSLYKEVWMTGKASIVAWWVAATLS